MTVLHISIGPVQGFLAASRKTRDLKNGSAILLACVKAIARILLAKNWRLVFPAADKYSVEEADAANILVAVHDNPENVEDMLADCRQAAIEVIKQKFQTACKNSFEPRATAVDSQIESFLEFFAGWTSAEDYTQSNEQASRNLAASKSLRHFKQPESGCHPKSSLMPDFESILEYDAVFKLTDHRQDQTFLKKREHLDAISFAKRFCDKENFASTRKIAVASLIKTAVKSNEFDELNELRKLATKEADEGDILFLYEDELNDAGIELKNACCVRKKFLDKYNDGKSPRPYFAVLHADGDSMGATLKAIDAEVEHFSFSKTLGDFSKAVKGIVEEHCGAPVFAGGDDVVALLPVDTALACAKELHDKFSQMVKGPTLTVGVAFCPTENNLQDCVHFAKKLESEGKKLPGKDALAIGARVRSGSDLIVCGSWKSDLYERFRSVLDLYLNKEIPRGFFADVAELVRLTDGWKEGGYDTEAMNKEFCRIRKRKEPKPPESILESFNLEALRQLHAMLKMGHFLTRSGEEA